MSGSNFKNEAELCETFISALPDDWIAYRETGGFDILLVRKGDGFQIGIEAKLKLNAKVICQASEMIGYYYSANESPDCRAVLVPDGVGGDLKQVCRLLGLEVITMYHGECGIYHWAGKFRPELPCLRDNWQTGDEWFEFWPEKRISLPDYIPDTKAGDSSPIMLTPWKISAMKVAVLIEKTGYISRQDFNDLKISISRWTQGGMLAWIHPHNIRGQYKRSENMPDFRLQHPVNYQQIYDDFDKWNPRKDKA